MALERTPANSHLSGHPSLTENRGSFTQLVLSMATSSGEDLPRNLEFLFSRNRLNVAISRAQSLAVLVASPKLPEIRCNSIEQMRMVNALCRFFEQAA